MDYSQHEGVVLIARHHDELPILCVHEAVPCFCQIVSTSRAILISKGLFVQGGAEYETYLVVGRRVKTCLAVS